MGKLTEFFIGYDTNRQVYYPGEVLRGSIVVNLNEPMQMRGIKLELHGKAYCHWSEQRGSGDNRRTVHYSGTENLLQTAIWLYGNGGNKIKHEAGRFNYQFAFQLPPVLPSSFEGGHGHIRYHLKANIDRPWKFDSKAKRPLIINELIDTNNLMYSRGPGGEISKEVGCCFNTGRLHVAGSIDRACYCPGETIYINSQVENKSSRDMTALKGKLIQTITYRASGNHTKHSTKTLSKIVGEEIPQGQYANWANKELPVPACPPTINTSVVQVQYRVEIEVDVPWGFDPSVKMPITVGTVPFRQTYSQQFVPPQQPALNPQMPPPLQNPQPGFSQQQHPSAPPPPPPQLLGYPDMAPPSYAAAIGDQATNIRDDEDKHTFGEMSYLPVYTYAQPFQGPNPYANLPPPNANAPGYQQAPNAPAPGFQPPPGVNAPGYPAPPNAPGFQPQPGVNAPGYPAPPNANGYQPMPGANSSGYPPPPMGAPGQPPQQMPYPNADLPPAYSKT